MYTCPYSTCEDTILLTLKQLYLSFIAVAMNSRDRYEIIGIHEILHFIKNLVEVFA